MLRAASSRNKEGKIFYKQGELESLPIHTYTVDIVVSNLVLQYIADIEKVASEFARVLRDRGKVIISTDNPAVNDFYYAQDVAGMQSDNGFEAAPSGYEGPVKRRKDDIGGTVTVFHRSLESYMSAFAKNGFLLTNCQQPLITEEIAKIHPKWKELVGLPRIAVMEFTKVQTYQEWLLAQKTSKKTDVSK